MDKIYISRGYLKSAHYFFFSMAIFSLTAAIAFMRMFFAESTIFFFLCIIYANISFWLAYFFYKDYTEQVKSMFVIRRYLTPYLVLCISVVFMTQGMILFSPNLINLVYSTLFINYYYAFIVGIGAFLYAFKPIRRFLEFQSSYAIKKGMDTALEYTHVGLVREYKTGSDPLIDDILENIWSSRDYPISHVQRLEIELCQRRIEDIKARIELAESEGRGTDGIKMLLKEKEHYEKLLEKVKGYND